MDWIISANEKIYKCKEAFEALEYVDWGQSRKYTVGDCVYIYLVQPVKKIKYKCIIVKKDIPFEEVIQDKEFWLKEEYYEKSKQKLHIRLKLVAEVDTDELGYEKLLNHGLKGTLMGPMKLKEDKEELKEYIESVFSKNYKVEE